MNKKITLILVFAALLLAGCGNFWTSQSTPSITMTAAVTSSGDTLRSYYNNDSQAYKLDTVEMGDTVTFALFCSSYQNNLVSTTVTWDTTAMDMWTKVNKDFENALEPTSNLDALILHFKHGYNQVVMPISFLAKKPGLTRYKIKVVSDSKYPESEGSVEIVFRESKAPTAE